MKKLLLLLLVGLLGITAEAAPKKPNFIFIMVDDAGYGDFGCYGQKLFATPNIDRMAAKGMRFTQHYSGSTVCAPTRCSIMNGVHTGHAYVRGNREVQPEGQAPIPADMITIPHAAMQCPEEDVAPFRKKFPQFEDKIGKYSHGTKVKNPVAAFAGMMTRMDRGIGQVLDLLDELKIADNTLVLFTSDNGPHYEGGHQPGFFDSNGPLKGHKRDLYEGGIRVPLIAYWPGTVKAGKVSDHICAHWDLMPTFCELAKIPTPKHTDGISYVPTLTGKKQKKHKYLYWEFHSYGNAQAIRMGDWKAIRLKVKNDPDAPIRLFNLKQDIGETKNIAEKHPDVVKRIALLFKEAHTPSERFPLYAKKKQ